VSDNGQAKHGFVGIDSRGVPTKREEEVIIRLGRALPESDRLQRRLAATLSVIRDNMAGHPRGASGDVDPRARLICSVHERPLVKCDELEDTECKGEYGLERSDPTGSAASGFDVADRDRKELLARIDRACQLLEEAVQIAARYPVHPTQLEDVTPSPGEEWCRSCWKDDKYCEPITMKKGTNTPYHRGLCKWCGDRAKELGGDPPTWMVTKRHRGERVSSADMERAKQWIQTTGDGAKATRRRSKKR